MCSGITLAGIAFLLSSARTRTVPCPDPPTASQGLLPSSDSVLSVRFKVIQVVHILLTREKQSDPSPFTDFAALLQFRATYAP